MALPIEPSYFFFSNCTYKTYLRREVQETSTDHGAHMGAVSFSHGYCKSFLYQHSPQSGIYWRRKVVGHPYEALRAGPHENMRTDLMVQDEVAVNRSFYYAM